MLTKKMIMERLYKFYKFMSVTEPTNGRKFHLKVYNLSLDARDIGIKELTHDNVADEMASYSFTYAITGMSCSYDGRWCHIYVDRSGDFSTNIDADVIDLLCKLIG